MENATAVSVDTPAPRRDEAQMRFIKILEATTDIVAMADRRGRLLYLNVAGRRLLGLDTEGPLGMRSVGKMYPEWAYQVVLHEALPAALHAGSWSGETALLGVSGQELPVLQVVLAHYGEDGGVDFFSTICRDITDRKQKELERIEWANRYDAAIRASGQVLFDWDSTTGDMTYGGDLTRLLGFTDTEMVGGLSRLREIIHPQDVRAFDEEIERVLMLRDPFRHEFRVIRKDGLPIVIEAQGFFFLDRQGRIGRMVGFLKDITVARTAETAIQVANERLEQRVAERTAALQRLAAELQDSVRQQESVAKLGQRALAGLALDTLMFEAAELARNGLLTDCATVLEFQPEFGTFVVRAEVGWPAAGQPHEIRSGLLSQSGYALHVGKAVVSVDFAQERRFQVSAAILEAQLQSGVSVCIQAGTRPLGVLNAFSRSPRSYGPDDVSFLQSLANVLTAAIERLRVEEDMRRAQAEAEAANRAKSEFLSRMSHELRTPLNAILGFTQLLEIEDHNERQAESIRHISQAGQNLLNLINEVLDIARLDAGRMQFHVESFALAEFLREIVALSSPLAARHNISIELAALPPQTPKIESDRERLKQIFLSILSNAIKYNRPYGMVIISVTNAVTGHWRVSITDTGQGISEERMSCLFQPFERLGIREGGTEGGIGLALCQRLVTALGGRLGVASTINVGSTFWIELPPGEGGQMSIEESTPEIAPEALAPTSPAFQTILYVEDDVANYYLLERILEPRKQLKLLSAIQGSLGLDLAMEHQPDLILMDLNLPDMPGEHLLRQLKSDARTAQIPVIAVTGEIASNRPELLRQLGAVDVLVKPYRVTELLGLLDRFLTRDA